MTARIYSLPLALHKSIHQEGAPNGGPEKRATSPKGVECIHGSWGLFP